MGDCLVDHQAALIVVGDYVSYRDGLYRVHEVDPDPLRARVTLRLEECRYGDWNVPLTALIPVERLS